MKKCSECNCFPQRNNWREGFFIGTAYSYIECKKCHKSTSIYEALWASDAAKLAEEEWNRINTKF